MEAKMTAEQRHCSLPKLSTTREVTRRDSLSSSRTRDSGYNSDLDGSFTPLDYVDYDQQLSFSPYAAVTDAYFASKPTYVNIFGVVQDTAFAHRPCTSSPSSTLANTEQVTPTKELSHFNFGNSISECADTPRGTPAENDNGIEQWIKDNLPSHSRPKERVSSIVSLSSASSCEMYTNTDGSEDEHDHGHPTIRPALPRATLKTIDLIMRRIEVNLSYLAHTQCNGGNTGNTSTNTTANSHSGSRKASQGVGKRKSRSEDHQPPNEEDEDGASKRRRGSLATVESSETGLRFACPFFKHEPNRYRNRRTCPGPGWPTVHRMKEHLYRAHAQSIYCPRCYSMFDADIDLSNHLRSAQCQVSAPQPIEGIDRETLKALRKRSPALRLEEDKWRDVYHLLFPNVSMDDIPSPFYDSDAPSENSRRFRRELMRRVQQELYSAAGQLPGPVEQQLLRQVAQIIRHCEDDLLNSFDSSSLLAPPLSDRRSSDTSTIGSFPTQPVSQRHTPGPEMTLSPSVPLPAPTYEPMVWDGPSDLAQRPPEPPVQFRDVPWDAPPAQTPSSEWIDWDAIFPTAPPESSCHEPFFSVPMWTRQISHSGPWTPQVE